MQSAAPRQRQHIWISFCIFLQPKRNWTEINYKRKEKEKKKKQAKKKSTVDLSIIPEPCASEDPIKLLFR